jgi:hypothetical protein
MWRESDFVYDPNIIWKRWLFATKRWVIEHFSYHAAEWPN